VAIPRGRSGKTGIFGQNFHSESDATRSLGAHVGNFVQSLRSGLRPQISEVTTEGRTRRQVTIGRTLRRRDSGGRLETDKRNVSHFAHIYYEFLLLVSARQC
jgi:hypothetical protein